MMKLFVATLLFVFLSFFIWKESFYFGCMALLLIIGILFVVSHSFIQVKVKERFCFRDCYFNEKSFIANLLSSRFLIIILYIIISILMTISIAYSILDFTNIFWIYLIFHIFLSVIIFKYLNSKLKYTIKQNFLLIFSREISINITSFILIIIYIYISLDGYKPAYIRQTLEQTQLIASNTMNSNCGVINFVLKLKIEIDSLAWWTLSNISVGIDNSLTKSFMWILFLLFNALAILGINRFILQIAYYIENIFLQNTKEKRSEDI